MIGPHELKDKYGKFLTALNFRNKRDIVPCVAASSFAAVVRVGMELLLAEGQFVDASRIFPLKITFKISHTFIANGRERGKRLNQNLVLLR